MKKLLLLSALIIFIACEKEEIVPVDRKEPVRVMTLDPIRIGQGFATVGGQVENIEDYNWTYGFSYGESKSMRLNTTAVRKGSAKTFGATINNLYPGRTYYYNVYVNITSGGTTKTMLGEIKSFTTTP